MTTSVSPSSSRSARKRSPERVRLLGVEPGGRLVEQEQIGAGGDRRRDLDDARGPVRQVAESLAREMLQAEQLEREVGARVAARAPRATLVPSAEQTTPPAGVARRARSGRATRSSAPFPERMSPMSWNVRAIPSALRRDRRETDELDAAVPDRAGRRREPGHRVEERRLPGAVRADQTDDLAASHLERQLGRSRRCRRTRHGHRFASSSAGAGIRSADGRGTSRSSSACCAAATMSTGSGRGAGRSRSARREPVEEPADAAVDATDALREHDHRRDQQRRGRDRKDALRPRSTSGTVDDELRQSLEEKRGGEDAGGRAPAADDDDRDELQRLEQQEGLLGADRARLHREHGAAETDDGARQRVREQLRRPGLDAEALRALLDVADREERAARLRDRDAMSEQEHERQAREREQIELHVAFEERRARRARVRPR